ncbi:MAG: RDD family protein [Archangium sp.]
MGQLHVVTPAPIASRAIAGAIDGFVIVVLSAISILVPLFTRGIVVPMWGVLVVLIGYSVAPLAGLKRTLGMQLMNLELVRPSGHALDAGNLLFRELVGRGYFPAAYLFTVVAGLIASMAGVGGNVSPPVLTGVMTLACAIALALSLVGNMLALERRDRRTLADLLAGSIVVQGRALPLPTDVDELEEHRANQRKMVVRIIVVNVVLLIISVSLPWLFAQSTSESPQAKIARMKLESLEAKFRAAPDSNSLTEDLKREYWRLGREEDVKRVDEVHRKAASGREAQRELMLREKFDAEPRRRDLAESLIALLEQQDRVDEAEVVYRQFLGESPPANELAGFGNWLAANGKNDTAIAELTRAVTMDPLVAYGHTLLGVALQRAGRFEEAREHLALALLDDPDDDTAQDAMRDVEIEIGPLDAKTKKSLEQRVAAWKKDAGSED